MRILPAEQHRKMPWRNGGGSTWEVLREPATADLGESDLRLSFAAIEASGSFSSFPGLDRVLTLVRGGDLTLVVDGRRTVLTPGECLRFDGAAAVTSEISAPSVDFNVMTRRGTCTARVEVETLAPESIGLSALEDETVFLAILDGRAWLEAPGCTQVHLEALDVVAEVPAGTRIGSLDAVGATCAVVRVTPVDGDGAGS